MRKANIISSALVFLAGLLLLLVVIPVYVPTILDGEYGLLANDLPNVMAITITVLSGLFFIYSLKTPVKDPETDTAPLTRGNVIFLLKGGVFLIVLNILLEWFGFLVAGPVLVAGFMLMMGERRPIPIAITAIGAPLIVWLFFVELLVFPLP